MKSTRLLALGLLFVLTAGVLGFYTLFLTDIDIFGKASSITVHFPEARGLRQGDSVLVAGMRVGRVSELAFDPEAERDKRITVSLRLEHPLVLREDYEIAIEDATLLGGRNVAIEPGTPGRLTIVLDPDLPLQGSLIENPLQALASVGDLIKDNRESVRNILDNLEALTQEARAGQGVVGRLLTDEDLGNRLASSITKIETITSNFSDISTDLRAGKGALGRLVYDEPLAEDLADAVLNISEVTAGLQAGEGTLGRLLKDQEMSDDVAAALKSGREIMAKVNEGQGTLGAIINDSAIADDLGKVLSGLADGEGSLGLLLTSDELYVDAKVLFENLSAVSATVRSGEGSLGKMVMNSELYDEALTAVSLLTRSLEDFREAAPVSTFTSVLFGAY